uniref:Metalloproteinase n=1 Tax=Phalotris mertensi TaxID=1260334 RepID=A0A182C5R5_9SAUR
MIQALLVTICLVVFPYQGSSIILESGNVNEYEVVYPQKVQALPKGGLQNAEPETQYEDTMQYEFQVNGEPVVLHLERNKGLFSEDYSETHYSPDGREITTSPPVQDHCYYHGYIQNYADSTAVISACDGLKGHFKHQGEIYFIEPLKLSNSEAHAVYKYDSLEKEDETHKTCGVTQTTWELDEPIEKISRVSITPEKQTTYMIARKYIEFVIVVDNGMFRKYSSNFTVIRRRIHEIVNMVNAIYKPLKIHVALICLEIWSNGDQIKVTSNPHVTLPLFGKWRETDLLPRKKNDNAQLLTSVDLDGDNIGYAYVGSICHPNKSSAIVQDHSDLTSFMAPTVAHELGHNLGMDHDTKACDCSSNTCVMAPSAGPVPEYQWSECSIRDHWWYLIKKKPQCILNKANSTDIVEPAVCGNNFVDMGEECDCGSPQDCQNGCCNATTCQRRREPQCEFGVCCEQCRFKGARTECRASKDDCDLAEYCTGQSAECPTDLPQRDGEPCENNQGYCYNGKCPTLTKQCIDFLGTDSTVSPDYCFENNTIGDDVGYCRRENDKNIPCQPQDVKCGRLYCTKHNENTCTLEYIPYYPDYGMVKDGTKCADERVCSNGQCVEMKKAYRSDTGFSQV